MARFLLLLFLSLCFAYCGSRAIDATNRDSLTGSVVPADSLEITKYAYARAISEYLISAYQSDSLLPDTLFIGKHDQFPKIQLPDSIEGVAVCVLTNEAYEPKTKYRKHSVFTNMIEIRRENHWDFMMVVFYDWGNPQYNFHVSLDYVPESRTFVMDSVYYEYAYRKK